MNADKNRPIKRLAAAALVLALGWLGLRWFERVNIYSPGHGFTVIPGSFGLAHEEVSLRAEDGVTLHGWYIPEAPFKPPFQPRAAGKPVPKAKALTGPLAAKKLVLLYCHGNAGNISNRVLKGNIFHRLGLSVLLFDYRGYGKSSGSPSEAGTYRDAEAAYRWLTEAKGFPPKNIIIYGESLGNAVALETALRHPPKVLILDSAFTSIVDMGREVFPWLPVRWMTVTRYDNLAKIPKIRWPVLVMHSKDDGIVPFKMGQALFAAAPEPKEFFQMKGTHDEGFMDVGEAYPLMIQRFLEKHCR